MKSIALVLLLFLPFMTDAQKGKRKVSFAKGTIYGYWGYNRSGYTKSNMHFVGSGYDFTMKGAKAHDNPEKFDAAVYFHPKKVTIPQFNARIGYYFKDNWSISVGYDHMKYLFADKNEVFLSGSIDSGVDTMNNWEGTYNSKPITTDRSTFHYENSDGLNYLRFEITRTDQWWKTGNKDWFAFSTKVGLSAGGILSFNDFRFGTDFEDVRTISLSGYGLSGHLGLRFEFFRHLFIQSNLGAGFHHQVKVNNRPNDPSAYTRHAYGYCDANVVIGFLVYLRGKNACDSCPTW